MNWSTKVSYFKRNSVMAVKQIDCIFRKVQVQGQVLMENGKEFRNWGTEHFHTLIYVDASPKTDKDENRVVVEFIDKYIMCCLPDKFAHLEFYDLVKNIQSQQQTTTCCKKKRCYL